MRHCFTKINCRSIRINDIVRPHNDVTDVRIADLEQDRVSAIIIMQKNRLNLAKVLCFFVAKNLGNLTVRRRVCSIPKTAQKPWIAVSVNFFLI